MNNLDFDYKKLISEAIAARQLSYSPYSKFAVGAALLAKNGRIFRGCNIENSAFSPTNCAERTAFFTAISSGEREFTAIAIAGWAKDGQPDFAYPCGVCRQVMAEFCNDDFVVITAKSEDDYKAITLSELLPFKYSF